MLGEHALVFEAFGDIGDQGEAGGFAVEFDGVGEGFDKDDAAIAAADLPGPGGLDGVGLIDSGGDDAGAIFFNDEVEGFHGEQFFAGHSVEDQSDVVGGEDLAGLGVEDEHGGGIALEEAVVLGGVVLEALAHVVFFVFQRAEIMPHEEKQKRGGDRDEEKTFDRLEAMGGGRREAIDSPVGQCDPEQAKDEVIQGVDAALHVP